MRNRIVFYMVLLFILFALGWLGHQSYHRATAYLSAQSNHTALASAKALSDTVSVLEDEIIKSMIYLGNRGKTFLPRMQKARAASDAALAHLAQICEGFDAPSMTKNIKYARANIDAHSGDLKSVLEGAYNHEILSILVDTIAALKTSFSTLSLQENIQAYGNIVRSEVNMFLEKALLVYLQCRQQTVDDKGLVLLKQFLGRLSAPNLSMISDKALVDKLKNAVWSQKEMQDISAIRSDILSHLGDGKFDAKMTQDIEAYRPLLTKSNQAKRMLFGVMERRANSTLSRIKNEAIQYGTATLIFLMILYFLIRTHRGFSSERKALQETLREIISELEESRRKELNSIIRDGDTISIYRFLAEITREANEAREQAIEAEKAKDLFLANMSHEIRTPLNGIVGFTQLIESTNLDDKQRGFIDIIKGSSDNLLVIVNSILDLSKIRAKKVELEAITFSPAEVFGDAIEPLEVQASDKKIRYCSFIDPRLSLLVGDPTRLRQVLTNLVGNAIKFTEAGGVIHVSIELTKSSNNAATIRFSVRDSGIGITSEQKEKIFDAFAQADSSTTREFGGTGLGLAITSDLVKHMGGHLEVDSEPGKGSEFFFTLTLEKAGDDERLLHNLHDIRIAYYHLENNKLTNICDKWVMRYLKEINSNAASIHTLTKDLAQRYDVIFVDYSTRAIRENIFKIFSLGIKIVILGYISYKDEIDKLVGENVSVIYRPFNYIKATRILESIFARKPDVRNRTRDNESPYKELDLSGLNILVAEDNAINQNLINVILSNFDLNVTLANNGSEAFELRKKHTYDLILMDIQMPVMGGIEATEKILAYEQNEGKAHVPIIALTANALQGDREKYLRVGMDDYVSKPIKIEQIRQVIQKHCAINASPKKLTNQQEEKEVALKSGVEPFETTKVTVSSVEQLNAEIPEEVPGYILLYCRSGLVQNIHKHALEKDGFQVDIAENETILFEYFEKRQYRYALLDARLIPEDNCVISDVIRENGTTPIVYAMEETHPCASSTDGYTKIDELRSKLTN